MTAFFSVRVLFANFDSHRLFWFQVILVIIGSCFLSYMYFFFLKVLLCQTLFYSPMYLKIREVAWLCMPLFDCNLTNKWLYWMSVMSNLLSITSNESWAIGYTPESRYFTVHIKRKRNVTGRGKKDVPYWRSTFIRRLKHAWWSYTKVTWPHKFGEEIVEHAGSGERYAFFLW